MLQYQDIKKGSENIMPTRKSITLEDVLTDDEKETIKEYRELMAATWSKSKSDDYYRTIMEILDEAEKRYYQKKDSIN